MSPTPAGRSDLSTSPSTLAGTGGGNPAGPDGQSSGAPDNSATGGDEGLKSTVQRVRFIQTELMSLAKENPTAAKSFRMAAQTVRTALKDVIANPGTPEPTAPNIGG